MSQLVQYKCTEREFSKFKSYIEEVEKITRLLLKLSRRLARAENDLRNAPMATDDEKVSVNSNSQSNACVCCYIDADMHVHLIFISEVTGTKKECSTATA